MLKPTQLKTLLFSLRSQELDKWIVPYLTLLCTFSGLEEIQERKIDNPHRLISRILEDTLNIPTDQIFPLLTERFVHFPLFNWRARRQHTQMLWNPTEQTLEEFSTEGKVIFYEDTTPYPDADQVEKWLRQLLKQ